MKKLRVQIAGIESKHEFLKTIGFISEDIIDYMVVGSMVEIILNDSVDEKKFEKEMDYCIKHFMDTQSEEKVVFQNETLCEFKHNGKLHTIHYFEKGMLSLEKEAHFILNYFDKEFESFAFRESDNCIKKIYPVLLPTHAYNKTGYLKKSPQYAMFCCPVCENIEKLQRLNDNIENNGITDFLSYPKHAMPPSACFHTYLEYENQTLEKNTIVTFVQSVFRNEGRFNYDEFGRLKDYHVREIVFIGDSDYVSNMRQRILKRSSEFIQKLGLNGIISTASDPFIIPKLQKYKKIQLLDASKYELRLKYDGRNEMSVASFNLHGTAFSYPFNIKVKNSKNTVTGCVGFGLERWVLSFLCQYGENPENWPVDIKEAYKNERY